MKVLLQLFFCWYHIRLVVHLAFMHVILKILDFNDITFAIAFYYLIHV